MLNKIIKHIKNIFKKEICKCCYKQSCKFKTYEECLSNRLKCQDHPIPSNNPPSYCHHCCFSKGRMVQPTIYNPNSANEYDWCRNWMCFDCFDRPNLEKRMYNNTTEAAKLAFESLNDSYTYRGAIIKADFDLSYYSLATHVTKIIDACEEWLYLGIDFEAIILRDNEIYIKDSAGEYLYDENNKLKIPK